MRAFTWIGGAGMALLAAVGLLTFQFTTPVSSAPKAEMKAIADDRDELANKLMERVTLKDAYKNVALKEVLDALSEKHGITIIVDQKSFAMEGMGVALNAQDDAILNMQISVPAMKNVRLATVLKYAADQVDGVYLIYSDHIGIVSADRAFKLLKLPKKPANFQGVCGPGVFDDEAESTQSFVRSLALLTASFTEKPLQEALKEIEIRTNSTIVLANQAGENGRAFVTARFTNVPVESAVATLAELAGLKMARKGNVLLVTTQERADEFAPGPAAPMPPAPPADQAIEELKMKVAELEKSIAEMKQKK